MFQSCRCLRLSLYGLLLDGPVGHAWYKLLVRAIWRRGYQHAVFGTDNWLMDFEQCQEGLPPWAWQPGLLQTILRGQPECFSITVTNACTLCAFCLRPQSGQICVPR
jgi:hypothetical protein